MRTYLLLAAISLVATAIAFAHPGTGVVVDERGQIFFVETGDIDIRTSGQVWKVDAAGRLSAHYRTGAHALVHDPTGRFANVDLRGMFQRREVPHLERIAATDTAPYSFKPTAAHSRSMTENCTTRVVKT